MILDFVLELLVTIVDGILSFLDILPPIPTEIIETLDTYLVYVYDAVPLMSLFVNLNYLKLLLPLWIAVINLDRIYFSVMWVIKKIPMLDIK